MRTPLPGQVSPRLEVGRERRAVVNAPLAILKRPRGQGRVTRNEATGPLALIVGQLPGMVGVAALHDSGIEELREWQQPATLISIGNNQALRVVRADAVDGGASHAHILEFMPLLRISRVKSSIGLGGL